jgi:chromosome partitioning protein
VVNQKGGVGKSTTAVSLGAALADMGRTVLVMDLDPQGNASTGLGIREGARSVTTYEILLSQASVEDAVVPTEVSGLFGVPSTIDLAGAEIELVSQFSREMRLRKALESLRTGHYDFILLDCPPSLGLITVNALAAAGELIVPIQCEYYALEGLGQLLRNVRLVQQNVNPTLKLTGIVLTMYDPRTKLSEQVVAEVRKYFGPRVYETIIPRTVRLSEAPGYGQPITLYDPASRGAKAYRALAREVAGGGNAEAGVPDLGPLPSLIRQPAPAPASAPGRNGSPARPEEDGEDAAGSALGEEAGDPEEDEPASHEPPAGPPVPNAAGASLATPDASPPVEGFGDEIEPPPPAVKRRWRLFRRGTQE